MVVRVQTEPFDLGRELAGFGAGNVRIGGIASFIGLVRDMGGLTALTLEHYPGMTERELERIEGEARKRWDLEESLIVHRYGRMEPGEPIVLVVTAATHRAAAFESCEFLMDWLKTKAPFWKLEETAGGTNWIEAKDSDDMAAARWDMSNR
jgi:molybdopterin synthase catalytic subunit